MDRYESSAVFLLVRWHRKDFRGTTIWYDMSVHSMGLSREGVCVKGYRRIFHQFLYFHRVLNFTNENNYFLILHFPRVHQDLRLKRLPGHPRPLSKYDL